MKRREKGARRRARWIFTAMLAAAVAGLWVNGHAERERAAEVSAAPASILNTGGVLGGANESDAADGETNALAETDSGEDGGMDTESREGMGHAASAAQPGSAKDGARWEWTGGKPLAGKNALLRITLTDAAGNPDASLEVSHAQKLHLIIVSKGLSTFMHLHPIETATPGVFETEIAFPAAGSYRLVADFKPAAGEQQWQSEWVTVGGQSRVAEEPALVPDQQLVRGDQGMSVKLTFDAMPRAGEPAALTYAFADATSGEPLRDLQPYLGEAGHVVIMDAKAQQYLHVHAMGEAGGPHAMFHTVFPKPGIYKIWGQFQRNGSVVTIPFVVEVH